MSDNNNKGESTSGFMSVDRFLAKRKGAMEALIREAYFTGYAQGLRDHEDAYDRGFENGYELGYSEGHDRGFGQGVKDAWADGYSQGAEDGYKEGYDQGFSEANGSDVKVAEDGDVTLLPWERLVDHSA